MRGHKFRDWLPFGSSTYLKLKSSKSSGGGQDQPRHKRRTPSHNKGVAFPGMWRPK